MLSKQLKMIVLSCFLLAATPMLGQCNELLQGIPASDGPLKVFFGFNLVNITDVNEKEETIDFDAEIILSWVDSLLIPCYEFRRFSKQASNPTKV